MELIIVSEVVSIILELLGSWKSGVVLKFCVSPCEIFLKPIKWDFSELNQTMLRFLLAKREEEKKRRKISFQFLVILPIPFILLCYKIFRNTFRESS